MTTRTNTLYAPYGAYEMKATYQRNLVLATMATVALVALATGVGMVWPDNPPLVVIDGGVDTGPDSVVVVWFPPPPIRQDPWTPSQPERRPALDAMGPPVPVADSLFSGDPETVIPTQEEIGNAIGPGTGEGDFNGVINDSAIGNAAGPVAEPGRFVALEIYPALIEQHRGEYPRLAAMVGDEGKVVIHVLVDEQGRGIEARLAQGSGVASLDEAALAWGLKCVFSPGIQNGHPVRVWVTFAYEFRLDD